MRFKKKKYLQKEFVKIFKRLINDIENRVDG